MVTVTKVTGMENEFNRVIDALPGLVWTAFPDPHIDFLNRRWCEYTGLSVSPRSKGVTGAHSPGAIRPLL